VTEVCVIDASATLPWCFLDEATPEAMALLERLQSAEAWVPSLWRAEVANVLLAAERRQRITATLIAEFLSMLGGLTIRTDPDAEHRIHGPVLHLARLHRLTVYDAMYLDLAMHRGLPLATRDGDLCRAARAAQVTLIAA
jgi:predicted nucleic acid-binding protein